MNRNISFTINGKSVTLLVDVRQSLLEVLREHGYTSVKEGCGVGECGACTILIGNTPVDSCLYLAVWADGRTIRTVEGETRNGDLSEVQQAYLDAGAVQCGYCTPGLIMTSTAFVEKNKDNTSISRHDIKRAHAGNLCRCTGYETIIRAVEQCLTPEKPNQDTHCKCKAESGE
ncbi:MAG: xanthine dehydrogenase iron sulfur-binding subunit XdhC [Desulfobacteraceae bacterium]|nr:xanthine dehydrogenase iron sulfur-binding subunit XdhC [Desulfobacteraceae bacterium]